MKDNFPLVKLIQWILGRKDRLLGGLFISDRPFSGISLRTIVYIDGFNLYFGSLQGSPHRWLDISKLAHRISKEQNIHSKIVAVKYFTADIQAKLSERGQDSCISQRDYLLALQAHISDIEIIKGKYFISKAHYYPHGEPVDFSKKHTVWRAEEKQTDVNIAVHMLCDVIDNKCEQLIIFSNDSDLCPALSAIKERHPEIVIGTVAPLRGEKRNASADLKKHSDWTRNGIRIEELESSLLPDKVVTRKRVIKKPGHW